MTDPKPHPGTSEPGGDYLWDRSGPSDPVVSDLERVLEGARHRGTPPARIPAIRPVRRWAWVALAAAVVIVVALGAYLARPKPPTRGEPTWTIAGAGGPVPGGRVFRESAPGGERSGLEFFAVDNSELQSVQGGRVTAEAGSTVRVFDLGTNAQRVALASGAVFTQPSKSALPIEIETPWGIASVRPGTSARVRVTREGGEVEVKDGRVDFGGPGMSPRVPGGCVASLGPGGGVGLPYRSGASPEFRDVVRKLESIGDAAVLARLLPSLLKDADPRLEGVTFWNLMWRVDESGRKWLVGAWRGRAKSDAVQNEEGLIRLDVGAMDAWWKALRSY